MLLFAVYTGWSLLDRERQDGAVEYMLSLPYSRTRLLLLKFLPRLVCAAIPLGAYFLVHSGLQLPSLLSPRDLAMIYGGFFFIGLALSLSLRAYISALFFTLLIHPGQILLMKLADPLLPLSTTITYTGISAVILAILFTWAFRSWDLRPMATFHRRFLPAALVTVILAPLLVFFTYGRSWGLYYLTQEGTLIRAACNRSEAVSRKRSWRFSTCMTALRQLEDGSLYLARRVRKQNGPCRILGITRYLPAQGKWESIAAIPEGWQLQTGVPGETGTRRGETLYLTLKHNTGPGTFAILEVRGAQTRLHMIHYRFDSQRVVLLAAAPGAERFLLFDGDHLWDWSPDSAPRMLLSAEITAIWKNRILVQEDSRLRLYAWSGSGLAEKATINGPVTWVRRWGSGQRCRHMLFKRGEEYLHLDMESTAPVPIPLDTLPVNYVNGPQGLTVISRDEQRLRIDIWQGTQRRTRFWQPAMDYLVVSVFPSGIVVSNSRHFEVYRFK